MTDYRKLIESILSDVSGNGHRRESAARLANAALFYEAAKACGNSGSFPLSIISDGESFWMHGPLHPPYGPGVFFKRAGERLVWEATGMPSVALGDLAPRHEWEPAKSAEPQMRSHISHWIEMAVEALTRAHALNR